LAFVAPTPATRSVQNAATPQGFLAQPAAVAPAPAPSAAAGLSGALAVAGASVAAVSAATSGPRRKTNRGRAAAGVVACRGLAKKSIADVDLLDKRVFIRVDFNVPQDKQDPNIITNTARIDAALPTIKFALEKGARSIVLCSHLGRPNGEKNPKFSMAPVAAAVEERLRRPVALLSDVVGPGIEKACAKPATGSIFLLENSRFYIEEEGKGKDKDGNKITADPAKVKEFRASLAKLADVYCSDAFGTAHRAHSSMVGEGFAEKCSGFLLAKELDYFAKVVESPTKPVCGVLGGAKVADKIQLIMNLLDKVDILIIGGGMAFTFIKEAGVNIGDSLYDEEGAKLVPEIRKKAAEKGVELILPVDFICSSKFGEDGEIKPGDMSTGVPDGFLGLDIGPKSIALNDAAIAKSKTIVWNGPMGVFEMTAFEEGTKRMMAKIVEVTAEGAISVIGGGDTATACKKYKTLDKVSHCSTGGGASLELLEGKILPGVAALDDADTKAIKAKESAKSTEAPSTFDVKRQFGVTAPLGFFDPLGFCKENDETEFRRLRAAEIKHGRVAMMASFGAVFQHFIQLPPFEDAPTGVRALWKDPSIWGSFGLILIVGLLEAIIWLEPEVRLAPENGGEENGEELAMKLQPGDFGDPLGLGGFDADTRNRELNNGRAAMFASLGIIAADLTTGKDAVEQIFGVAPVATLVIVT